MGVESDVKLLGGDQAELVELRISKRVVRLALVLFFLLCISFTAVPMLLSYGPLDLATVIKVGSDFHKWTFPRSTVRTHASNSVQHNASLEVLEEQLGLFANKSFTHEMRRENWRAKLRARKERWENSPPEDLALRGRDAINKTCNTFEKVETLPIIVVVSNRRSGTHMTMDLLHNMFPDQDKIIIKANHVTLTDGDMDCRCRDWLLSQTKVVHAHRNLLDLVVSYYYYRRGFDAKFRRVSWKRYVEPTSKYMKHFLKKWVETTHGWYTEEEVFNLSFEDVVNINEETINNLGEFLDMEPTKKPKAWNRTEWTITSNPVASGRGLGEGGFDAVMTDEVAHRLVEYVKQMPEWKESRLLTCPPERPFLPDEICVRGNKNHWRTLIRNEHDCQLLGIRNGDPKKRAGIKRTWFCIPKSCPKDLKQGIIVANYKNRTFYKKRAPLGFRDW